MKNLKKLSRQTLKDVFGGKLDPNNNNVYSVADGETTGQWCHFHYTGSLWSSDMVYTTWGDGGCHAGGGKCYSYFATGGTCKI